MFLSNLLYPAILGAFVYEIFSVSLPTTNVPGAEQTVNVEQIIFQSVVLMLFAMDYLYTIIDEDENKYSWLQFAVDCAIVGCLFLAFKASELAVAQRPDWLHEPVWWMFLTKLLSVVWEASKTRTEGYVAFKRFEVRSDALFLVAYAVV